MLPFCIVFFVWAIVAAVRCLYLLFWGHIYSQAVVYNWICNSGTKPLSKRFIYTFYMSAVIKIKQNVRRTNSVNEISCWGAIFLTNRNLVTGTSTERFFFLNCIKYIYCNSGWLSFCLIFKVPRLLIWLFCIYLSSVSGG